MDAAAGSRPRPIERWAIVDGLTTDGSATETEPASRSLGTSVGLCAQLSASAGRLAA